MKNKNLKDFRSSQYRIINFIRRRNEKAKRERRIQRDEPNLTRQYEYSPSNFSQLKLYRLFGSVCTTTRDTRTRKMCIDKISPLEFHSRPPLSFPSLLLPFFSFSFLFTARVKKKKKKG